MTKAILVAAAVVGGLMYLINTQLGATAALCFLFFILGIATSAFTMMIGARLQNSGQENFIRSLAHLKTVMAPTVREDARTRGALDRASIRLIERESTSIDPKQAEIDALYDQYADYY